MKSKYVNGNFASTVSNPQSIFDLLTGFPGECDRKYRLCTSLHSNGSQSQVVPTVRHQ